MQLSRALAKLEVTQHGGRVNGLPTRATRLCYHFPMQT
jgi:hypothetical protein